jgi:ABC-type lipoprotein export system ATPase subunit
MPHIEARDITLIYDTPGGTVPGVRSVNFGMEASEFLCVVGPSGCGKSTLLNIIAGFVARRSRATAWIAASCSRILPSFFPGARRSAMSPSAWK